MSAPPTQVMWVWRRTGLACEPTAAHSQCSRTWSSNQPAHGEYSL